MKVNKITACKDCEKSKFLGRLLYCLFSGKNCSKIIYDINSIPDDCKLSDLITIWHDPKEEIPEKENMILVVYNEKTFQSPGLLYIKTDYKNKNIFLDSTKKWAYLEDILKLTGGIIE